MADVAALSMAIDSRAALKAAEDLGRLETAGKSVEKSFQGTGRAVERGISPSVPALNRGRQALDQYGMSAKQTSFAMRQLPAQITDIVTGLVSGQPAYMVAIQQGGQLRDMFGGVGNAMRAVGTILTPTRLAILGMAGAIGGLVAAYVQGAREGTAFHRALVLSGNAAGTNTDELARMARTIDAVIGTQREASAALAALAETGRVGAAQLERFATVAVRLERSVGQPVEKTAKAFSDLAKAPVEASLRLNDEIRHLTTSTFEQIRALDEAGDSTEAARVAMEAYASAMEGRSEQIVSRLGLIERTWQSIKDLTAEAVDALRGIGRPMGLQEQYEAAQQRLAGLRQMAEGGGGGRTLQRQIEQQEAIVANLAEQVRMQTRATATAADRVRIEQEGVEASQTRARIIAGTLTTQEKLNKELRAYRDAVIAINTAQPGTISPEQQAREEAAIRARFARATQERETAAQRMLRDLERSAAIMQQELDTGEKLTGAARRLAEFEAEIAMLKEQRTLTADQKSLLANEQALRAQLEKNAAVEREVELREVMARAMERQAKRELESASQRLVLEQRLQQMIEGRREQYGDQLAAFGQGDRAVQRIREQAAIRRDFERAMAQAAEQATREGTLGSDEYRNAIATIRSALDTALADHERYYAAIDQARQRADVGASRGLMTYLDEVSDVAGQTESLFTDSFRRAEDAATDFFTKGKSGVRAFVEFVRAEVARMAVRQLITRPLAGALSGLFGNIGPTGSTFAQELAAGVRPMATGGFTQANRPLLVGEKGPELFVPKMPGTVVPNHALGAPSATVNQVINIDSRSDAASIRAAMQHAKLEAVAEITQAMRYGSPVYG